MERNSCFPKSGFNTLFSATISAGIPRYVNCCTSSTLPEDSFIGSIFRVNIFITLVFLELMRSPKERYIWWLIPRCSPLSCDYVYLTIRPLISNRMYAALKSTGCGSPSVNILGCSFCSRYVMLGPKRANTPG